MPASGPGEVALVAAEGGARLCVRGEWTLAHHAALVERVRALSAQAGGAQAGAAQAATVDVDGLAALDTAGARLLHALLGPERIAALLADETALPRERRALLKAVADALAEPPVPAVGAQGSALGERRVVRERPLAAYAQPRAALGRNELDLAGAGRGHGTVCRFGTSRHALQGSRLTRRR